MNEQEEPKCSARKTSPTANGDVESTCIKPPGHVERGDRQHEAWIGMFPVRWED